VKLVSVILPADRPTSLRVAQEISLERPVDNVLGWQVLVRGPAVLLITREGRAHEFARSACVLTWSGAKELNEYDNLAKYTSGVLARIAPDMSEQELERATAPTGKAVTR
jgi:hypothetical protein